MSIKALWFVTFPSNFQRESFRLTLPFLLIPLGTSLNLSYLQASTSSSDLYPLAIRCFNTRQRETCQRALSLSESVQRKAGDSQRYACQTMALGLGAELIIAEQHPSSFNGSLNLLEDVMKTCKGL